jgi:uncharacterized phosphosugar-binding protein
VDTVPHRYLAAARRILDHIETTQLDAVEQAADLVTQSILNGGAVFCSAIGHGNEGDFMHRAGGLACLQRFSFNLNVNAPVAKCLEQRERPEPFEREPELTRFALKASNLRAGDVMFVSSVSGKNSGPIELTLACQEMGVKVVGFTSFAYTAQVESLHSSGRKLRDVVDVAIDIGAPYGDAAVQVPGYDVDLLPVSGVSMTVIGWCIWGQVMAKTAAAGQPAAVLMSINREGGWEFHDKSLATYHERGF